METLKLIQRVFVILYICPTDGAARRWIRLRNIPIKTLTFLFLSTSAVSSTAFVAKCFVDDFESEMYVYAILQIADSSSTVYTLISAFPLRRNINGIFMAIQNIYKASTCESLSFPIEKHSDSLL